MFGSTILEVGMGLILIYLVLSLVCTAINEQISQALSLRGETLWNAVKQLLGDPAGTGLARDLFNNHLVRSQISKDIPKPSLLEQFTSGKSSASSEDLQKAAAERTASDDSTADASEKAKPSYLSPAIFAQALMQITENGTKFSNAAQEVEGLVHPMQKIIDPIINAAEGNEQAIQEKLEAVYNSAMDRASGVYKQQIQRITIVVGLLIAWSANADTLVIAQKLWVSPTLRQASVAAATASAYKPTSEAAAAPEALKLSPELTAATEPLLGWGKESDRLRRCLSWNPHEWGWLMSKLIGILITGFAISLGAPFWFDRLSTIINVRGSIVPGAKPVGGKPQNAQS